MNEVERGRGVLEARFSKVVLESKGVQARTTSIGETHVQCFDVIWNKTI